MARARNIKPGLFKNELLVEQPLFVRLLFIGLWTLADREGRLEDRPKRIKLELFPYDNEDTDAALKTLAECGFIDRYEACGKKVIQITNFLKHQTPHGTEKDSELPDKNGDLTLNERTPNGYTTGKKRSNNVKQDENNVHSAGNNGELAVSEHPDSLNPDSLNPEEKKKKTSAKPPRFDPLDCELPECLPMGVWAEWIAYRRNRKLTCNEDTIRGQLKNLFSWNEAGHDAQSVIRSSIDNGWQGLFEPKAKTSNISQLRKPQPENFSSKDYGIGGRL